LDEYPSYFLNINFIVFCVRTDKPDVRHPVRVIELHDQSIFVSRYVEYDSVITNYACAAKHRLYIVGLLAESILKKHPGGKIVHDPRMIWNTLDIVKAAGGEAVQSVSGHSFIKEKMREVDGISLDFGDWRFNLRGSNTEPVIRLNVESRGDKALMQSKVREILLLLENLP
jgi:hypothetical protein